jgi:hypothetical protein
MIFKLIQLLILLILLLIKEYMIQQVKQLYVTVLIIQI